jgi:uncharacterized flavoprotein (TIGR03862 family)
VAVTRSATVIGGGPAGLMAAEVLAMAGLCVTVYEHMPSVGRKLLLAGRSGLNITHNEPVDELVARYGRDAPRLAAAISAFAPQDLRSWCEGLGEATFVGSTGRVFPASFRATPLLRAWLGRLDQMGVRIELRHRWLGWGTTDDHQPDPRRSLFAQADGTRTEAISDVTVLALGGGSWPRVGSDGSWVRTFREAGLHVNDLCPANSGLHIEWTAHFAERFAGTPLKNVAVAIREMSVRGDATITRDGIESGPVYPLSSIAREALDRHEQCVIHIDLRPDLTIEVLAQRLVRRRPKDSLATSLRRTIELSPVAASLLREAVGNNLPTDPIDLATLVKAVPLVVHATAPLARAISSAGGVALAEVDDSFMLRRLPGTFLAGEMLDWDAPTGGYLLQASFSTAVAAARGAVAWLGVQG